MIKIIRRMGIRRQQIFLSLVLIFVVTVVIGAAAYDSASRQMTQMMKQSLLQLAVKDTQLMDARLGQIEQYAIGAVIDKDLTAYLKESYQDHTMPELYSLDKKISDVLNKYFLFYTDIYSVHLITDNYVFGNNYLRDYIPLNSITQSAIYAKAVQSNGSIVWIPTYDFADMFSQEALKSIRLPYRKMFSIVKTIDLWEKLPVDKEFEPLLLINLSDAFFAEVLRGEARISNVYSFVITPDGQYAGHTDASLVGKHISASWLNVLVQENSGYATVDIEGESTVICFDRSNSTGWFTVMAMPERYITQEILREFSWNLVKILAAILLVAMAVFYFAAKRIIRPIENLNKAIVRVGSGDFGVHIPETEEASEFRELIERFNSMSDKLNELIHENYEMLITKQEAELRALNMQLNPHFLHNTLGIINLKLIENGQFTASDIIVSLSNMLRYALDEDQNLVRLDRDLLYTKSYLHIMQTRLGNTFTSEIDIPERFYAQRIPKFILQPIVENSIVHGFRGWSKGGVIRLSCRQDGDNCVFTVSDNGVGMCGKTLLDARGSRKKSIGLENVRNRMTAIYGDAAQVLIDSKAARGVTVTLVLPLENP